MIDVEAGRMTRARSRLLDAKPFFGTLALQLQIESMIDGLTMQPSSQGTMATDGTVLSYNPAFTATQSDAELMGDIAHEVMHCAMLHPYHMEDRDPETWNRACDYAINPLIKESGLTLSHGVLDDVQYHGMSATQIYALLRRDEAKNGKPQPKPGVGTGSGDVQKAPAPAAPGSQPGETPAPAPGMTEIDWQVVTQAAENISRKAGKLPGDVERAIRESRISTLDWRIILNRFIENVIVSDTSWSHPDRRYVHTGIYLPGAIKENLPKIAVAIDTSGSVDQRMLDMFASEISAIMLDARPAGITVIYCDSRINRVDEFTPDDGEITLTPVGGGGTRFAPVFDYLNDQIDNGEQYACLIYLTDLESSDRPSEPEYPVLWITPDTTRRDGLFGETVRIPTW